MVRIHKRWTEKEDASIREHYPEHGALWEEWDTLLPHRTTTAIRCRAKTLDVKVLPEVALNHRTEGALKARAGDWREGDIVLLATWYPLYGARWSGWKELLPGKVPGDIDAKAKALGIGYRSTTHPITDKDKQAILTSIMAMACALRLTPRAVADEVIRLGATYDGRAS